MIDAAYLIMLAFNFVCIFFIGFSIGKILEIKKTIKMLNELNDMFKKMDDVLHEQEKELD